MRLHISTISWAPFVAILVLAFLPISNTFAQDTGLPEGCHIATPQEVSAGALAGRQVCPADQKAGINADVGTAKEYLNSLPKRPLSQCAPPTKENISRLNNSFAVCAAAFFKAYTAQYGTVYITSAFRNNTPGSGPNGVQSANQCAGGAPNSRHALGLAIDVNPANESLYPTMWKFASQNPQYGICFPYQDGNASGYYDRPHMVLAGIGGREGSLCAAQGVTKACSAGIFTSTPTGPATTGPGTAPTKNPGGASTCPNGYVLINNQCYVLPPPTETETSGTPYTSCTTASATSLFTNCTQQQPIRCSQGSLLIGNICIPFSQAAAGLGASTPQQSQNTGSGSSGSTGSSGGTPRISITQPANTNPVFSTSSSTSPTSIPLGILEQLNQSNNAATQPTSSPSAIDLIKSIINNLSGNGATSATTSTSSAALNQDILNITIVNSDTQTSGTSTATSSPDTLTTNTISRPQISGETFTSGNTPNTSSTYSPASQTNSFQTILANMKSILISILGYLRLL